MSESSIEESINLGAMGEALNDKMDRDGLNADINPAAGYGVDYVVEWQIPTAENNYTWYRKYASGWVEQGGYLQSNGSTQTVTLPKTMTDTNYTITTGTYYTSNTTLYAPCVAVSKTANSFSIYQNSSAYGCFWEVKGMAAVY